MGELVLSDFFTTKSQANIFSAHINSIMEKIYGLDFNLETSVREQFGAKKTDKFMSLLRENEISLSSDTALNNFFSHILEMVSALPVANITFAIEPNEQILKSVSDWFILNLKKQVLIEPEIDQNLIAGAVVGYQGKRLDSSVKSVFEQTCANIFQSTPKE